MLRQVCASCFIMAFVCGARAQDDEPLFSRVSDKTLEKIFDKEKLEWVRKESTDKEGKKLVLYWLTFPSGLKATVRNGGTALTILSLGFRTKDREDISLERMNEWNQRYGFWGAGFVGKDGSAYISTAHDMIAGTNQKIIGGWLKQYSVTLTEFERFTR
ncbi:MAG TPA: YbjN domain-containing protein [Gemmataceae bacterium]|nr:YbjN domain-containing protein [Gemmataceae bacterium]